MIRSFILEAKHQACTGYQWRKEPPPASTQSFTKMLFFFGETVVQLAQPPNFYVSIPLTELKGQPIWIRILFKTTQDDGNGLPYLFSC